MSRFLFYSDGLDGFEARSVARARELDHSGLPLKNASETEGLTFNSVSEMFAFLTPKRVAILELLAGTGETSLARLAETLRRSQESVLRDLQALSKVGVVVLAPSRVAKRSGELTVTPVATHFEFAGVIKSSEAA